MKSVESRHCGIASGHITMWGQCSIPAVEITTLTWATLETIGTKLVLLVPEELKSVSYFEMENALNLRTTQPSMSTIVYLYVEGSPDD